MISLNSNFVSLFFITLLYNIFFNSKVLFFILITILHV